MPVAIASCFQNKIINPKAVMQTNKANPKISKNRLGGDFCSRL
jgi:hypothetical protein